MGIQHENRGISGKRIFNFYLLNTDFPFTNSNVCIHFRNTITLYSGRKHVSKFRFSPWFCFSDIKIKRY